jgi:hypothetical protein
MQETLWVFIKEHHIFLSEQANINKIGTILLLMLKMRGLRNLLMLKGLSFSGPEKILLSKPVRR